VTSEPERLKFGPFPAIAETLRKIALSVTLRTGIPIRHLGAFRRTSRVRDDLEGHLKILERRGMLQSWHDRRLELGKAWDEEIDTYLRNADLVLLLLSQDFIAADYI
jgi:hypothetical protein